MTAPVEPNPQTRVLVQPFPVPGRLVQLAYRELELVSNGGTRSTFGAERAEGLAAAMGPCYLRDAPAAQGGLVLAGGCRHLAKP